MAETANGTAQAPMRVSMPIVRLEGGVDPFGGALDVIIHADTVQICGRVRLPGRRLVIWAREVEGEDGELDLSGAPAAPDHESRSAPPALRGTPEQPDGQPGEAGGDGHDGGELSLNVDRISGRLTVLANGSPGGRGQHGGNGYEPRRGKDGQDGSFTQFWPAAPAGPYGAALLHAESYPVMRGGRDVSGVQIAYGERGGDAKKGGNAGQGGRGGRGGHGGTVTVRWASAVSRQVPQLVANGAPPGAPGGNGAVGPAGKIGLGGRNRLFWYSATPHGTSATSQEFVEEASEDERYTLGRYKVSPAWRADAGTPTDQAGSEAAPPEPAPAGRPGQVVFQQTPAGALGKACEADYLEAVRRWAEQDAERGMEWVTKGIDAADSDTWLAGERLLARAQLGWMWLRALAAFSHDELRTQAELRLPELGRFVRAHPFAPTLTP